MGITIVIGGNAGGPSTLLLSTELALGDDVTSSLVNSTRPIGSHLKAPTGVEITFLLNGGLPLIFACTEANRST